MKLHELKSFLSQHPDSAPRFLLPDGDAIPAHFHITEVGHLTKRFIDCGGILHDRRDTCLLQTYVADDLDHRLNAATFAKILDLGTAVLPSEDVEVEVEYDGCVTAQYPLRSAHFAGETVDLQLEAKHTDCLAKEKCGINSGGETSGCC